MTKQIYIFKGPLVEIIEKITQNLLLDTFILFQCIIHFLKSFIGLFKLLVILILKLKDIILNNFFQFTFLWIVVIIIHFQNILESLHNFYLTKILSYIDWNTSLNYCWYLAISFRNYWYFSIPSLRSLYNFSICFIIFYLNNDMNFL